MLVAVVVVSVVLVLVYHECVRSVEESSERASKEASEQISNTFPSAITCMGIDET